MNASTRRISETAVSSVLGAA